MFPLFFRDAVYFAVCVLRTRMKLTGVTDFCARRSNIDDDDLSPSQPGVIAASQ